MNCPLCLETVLNPTVHADVELDICPTCRGVWLDRGELEKVMRGPDPSPTRFTPPTPARDDHWDDDDRDDDDRDDDDRDYRKSASKRSKKKSKKKQFADRLGDVFEEVLDL